MAKKIRLPALAEHKTWKGIERQLKNRVGKPYAQLYWVTRLGDPNHYVYQAAKNERGFVIRLKNDHTIHRFKKIGYNDTNGIPQLTDRPHRKIDY